MAQPDFIQRGHLGVDNASVGPVSQWTGEMPQYARRIEKITVGQTTTLYKAWALYGSAESADAWMIQRIVYTRIADDLDLTDGLAGGVAGEFGFSWTGRAGHAYS